MVLDAAYRLSHTAEPADYSAEIGVEILPPFVVNEWAALFGAEHHVEMQAVER
jgi:hypothetical protein